MFLCAKATQGDQRLDDLIRPGISVITPNPKTSVRALELSGGLGFALRNEQRSGKGEGFRDKALQERPVLDTGARGSTITFVERGMGDVLIAWENEALLSVINLARTIRIVVPSLSILAEPPWLSWTRLWTSAEHERCGGLSAVLVFRRRTEDRGKALLSSASCCSRSGKQSAIPKINLFTIDQVFGGWQKAQDTHFADNGVFDHIYQPGNNVLYAICIRCCADAF